MQSMSWWIEWPSGVIRIGVAFLVAATIAAAAVRYPVVLRDAGRDASRNSHLSFSDREIAGGNGLVVDQTAVYAARALIPEGDAFRVSVDPDYASGSASTVEFVDSYYRYFLVPRRMTEDAAWIICYGCDLSPYGSHATTVWEGADDISIVRIDE